MSIKCRTYRELKKNCRREKKNRTTLADRLSVLTLRNKDNARKGSPLYFLYTYVCIWCCAIQFLMHRLFHCILFLFSFYTMAEKKIPSTI